MAEDNKQTGSKVSNIVIALVLFAIAIAIALITFVSWSGLKVPV